MRSVQDNSFLRRMGQLLPVDMTKRFRLLIMLLAMSSTLTIWPVITSADDTSVLLRVLQLGLLSAVFWRWTVWYRTGIVRNRDLALELPAVLAIAYLLPDPASILTFVYTGVYFRPLFTNNRDTAVASGAYVMTYLGGMALAATQTGSEFGPATIVQGTSLLLGAMIVRTITVVLERSTTVTRELERAERQYRTLVEQLPGIVITFDRHGAAHYVSPRIKDILGYTPEEYTDIVKDQFRIIHEDDKRHVFSTMKHSLASREPIEFECRVTHADGELRWIRFEANIFEPEQDQVGEWRGIITDITEERQLADKLEHQAFHDALTDLPNRTLFEARLKHTIDMQSRRTSLHAVLFVDLDNFKFINDSLGHSAGDELLIAAAERIHGCLRSGDTIARLGGDEFAILLEDLHGHAEALEIAERIGKQLSVTFHLGTYPAYVSSSIGIAFNDSNSVSAEDLVRQADVAMYEAKHAGKSRHVVFDDSMQDRVWTRIQGEAEIRDAFERDEFFAYYQPVVDLQTGQIIEIEALVRWNHPKQGILEPDRFLPLVEEIGMMAVLDTWVLNQACRQTKEWQDRFPEYAGIVVSVNVSPALLQQPALASIVESALAASDLLPHCLRLEVTENTMFADIECALEAIHDLHALGVQIAIDDFGTGNSALSFLRKLPVDTLKIDRSYATEMQGSLDGLRMMTAVINLARSMGLTVTVEGIEHRDQTCLSGLGCDRGQGFLFSRPLPSEQIEQLLSSGATYSDRIGPPSGVDVESNERENLAAVCV